MNFLHPYFSFYYDQPELKERYPISAGKEVAWIFLNNLELKPNRDIQRVNIVLMSGREHGKTLKLGKILEYYIDVKTLENTANPDPSRLQLLDLIHHAFTALTSFGGWTKKQVDLAKKRSLKELNSFEFISGYRVNVNKEYSGRLQLNLNGDALSIKALIENQHTKKTSGFNLLMTPEENFSWHGHIRQFGWYDNEHFGLKFMKGDLWIVVNVTTGIVNEIVKEMPLKKKKMLKLLAELKRI